ncbi:SIR2 family protein [Pseudorhodoplanes sinuspersici]|nr:SIR2 family protein [Pseudorhodoplanes sinuspersici]RKE65777.1 SIR2-like protein [Pseudorhodoplanes sinuspersici]
MSGEQQSHDAQKTLTDLRDHLARHDKPIAFFFGAGTSCSVTVPSSGGGEAKPLIPAVPGLTAACKKDAGDLGEKYATAWSLIEAQCNDEKQDAHVENVLSRLRMMLNAVGKNDTLSGLKADEIKILEECLRKTIARLVTPDLSGLSSDFPHRKFARWLAKTSRRTCVEIFTVNYDVLIEDALEAERVPVFDGFVGSYRPFFHPDSLRRAETAPGSNWTRLWKMHGSVTWRRIEQDGRIRVVRGEPDPAGEMILPSFQKYDESRQQPYAAFTDRLTRFLEQDDALLVVAGFSFGDEHINNVIFGALENRPRTHVYALQFDELAEETVLIKRACQRSNLIMVGPKTGVIGGRRAKWSPTESPSFMDGVFELKEAPTTVGETAKPRSGLMKIGDFACFCHFLEAMAS